MAKCLEDGCTTARVNGLKFCAPHLDKPRRCVAVRKSTGERCKSPARRGLTVCTKHGGSGKKAAEQVTRAKAVTDMQRFVKPYEGDVDPISVFEEEFRRTLGRIKWYDHYLASLDSADELVWGLTKKEQINAAEHPGTNRTYEAKVHEIERLQFRERQHLVALEKVWIGAKLETEKLNLMKRYVEVAYSRMVEVLRRLGHDPSSPEVRDILAEVLTGGEEATRDDRALERP